MPGIKEKDEDSQGFCRVCPRGPPGADGAKSGNYLGLISSIIFPFFMRELSNNPKIQVLRRFLLFRAGSIEDITQLKAWASASEAEDIACSCSLQFTAGIDDLITYNNIII